MKTKRPVASKRGSERRSRSLKRVVRALSEWDERVLAAITTHKPEGVANWTILPNEYGAGSEISQSLQKLKRRGLAVIMRKHRGVTWWKAQRPNDEIRGGSEPSSASNC